MTPVTSLRLQSGEGGRWWTLLTAVHSTRPSSAMRALRPLRRKRTSRSQADSPARCSTCLLEFDGGVGSEHAINRERAHETNGGEWCCLEHMPREQQHAAAARVAPRPAASRTACRQRKGEDCRRWISTPCKWLQSRGTPEKPAAQPFMQSGGCGQPRATSRHTAGPQHTA